MGIRQRLGQLLRDAPGEAEAVEYDGAWWSWGQVQATAAALSRELDAAGVATDARIGIVLSNRPEHVAALLAVLATGRCVVTVSPLQPAARMVADLSRRELPVVIAGPDVLARNGVRDATGGVICLDVDGSVHPMTGEPRGRSAAGPDIAVEMLTSGSTGPPKRVRLSERQFEESLKSSGQLPKDGRLLSASASLVAVPLAHIGGLWGSLACLHAGRRLVLLPKFELEPWVSAVERHRLRAAGLVPAALRTLLDADVPPERLASLSVVTLGTASCPPELAGELFRRYGIRVLMTYGATEFAGAVAGWTLPLHEKWWDRKAGSTGRAFPGVELRVSATEAADGASVPAGTTGVLEVRSAQASPGGWMRTSDLARIDGDGFVWIVGRADDTIVRGGFKIQPETVKRALEAHSAVREAAVAGLPDDRLGAVPVAAVELAKGLALPQVEELIAHCRQHLLPYEVPQHLIVVDELPGTPSAKVSRVELLELLRAARDEEVSR